MTIRSQLWITMLWITIVMMANLCSLLLLAPGHGTAQPQTDRAAVMSILDQRGITYTDVQVGSDPAMPQDHFAYVARVIVVAERTIYGKIACLSSDDCVLWIEALGIYQVPLRPRVQTTLWEQLKSQLDSVMALLPRKQGGTGQH